MDNNSKFLPAGYILKGQLYTYKIEKVLGQGSFGITYLASMEIEVQGSLGNLKSSTPVTIKEFFMEDMNGRNEASVTSSGVSALYDNYKRKFAREAKNISLLKHKHIVNVLEFFEANNTIYYTMEFLRNGSLDDLIGKKGHLSEKETVDFTKQICEALMFMHGKQMLHLDLKPNNVMLRNEQEAVLIDFGLSKQYDGEGNPESSTTIGGGTPGYAPLEQSQYRQDGTFQATLDIYALGATMFKMITGHRAPEASEILNNGFPDNMLKEAGASQHIICIIAKAMMPLKKNRYQTVADLLADVNNIKCPKTFTPQAEDEKTQIITDVPQPKEEKKSVNEYKEEEETVIDQPAPKPQPKAQPVKEEKKAAASQPTPKPAPQPAVPAQSSSMSKGKLAGIIAASAIGAVILFIILVLSVGDDTTTNTTETDYATESQYSNSSEEGITVDKMGTYSEGLAVVKNNGKWGYIDEEGTIVIPIEYDNAWDFTEGRGLVKRDGKFGYVDYQGNEVIPIALDKATSFSNGTATVTFQGVTFDIDIDGNPID